MKTKEQLYQEILNEATIKFSELIRDTNISKQLLESFDADDIKLLDIFIEKTLSKSVMEELDSLEVLIQSKNEILGEDTVLNESLEDYKDVIIEAVINKVLAGIDFIQKFTESLQLQEQLNNNPETYELIIEACKRKRKKKK